MILDRIEHRGFYAGLGLGIPQALDYLARTDFSKVPDGKTIIDGERMFAMVQRYRAKPIEQARWEAHRRHLDVQYIVSGHERIGHVPLIKGLPVEEAYSEERDIVFFKTSGVLLPVPAGMFAIFTPYDVHSPGLVPENPAGDEEILKVVVKCRWE